jgi:hypothetical protein
MAVFEKQVEGSKKLHTNFFVAINRSYPDPKNQGQWMDRHDRHESAGSARRPGSLENRLGIRPGRMQPSMTPQMIPSRPSS